MCIKCSLIEGFLGMASRVDILSLCNRVKLALHNSRGCRINERFNESKKELPGRFCPPFALKVKYSDVKAEFVYRVHDGIITLCLEGYCTLYTAMRENWLDVPDSSRLL